MSVDMQMTYLDFVSERHEIWKLRQAGAAYPWTDDPILASRKFTNVFRILDPGTQFFMEELADAEPRDILARAILYRLTNRPETWTALRDVLGRYPLADDLNETTADVLCFLRDEGMQVFSGAYLIAGSLGARAGMDKSREAVLTSQRVLEDSWTAFSAAESLRERFASINAQKGMGGFMSMQISTDVGYAIGPDEENDFVVAGPGCISGAKTLFPTQKAEWVIRWAQEQIVDVALPNGRTPSLMDVQNTLCEWFKYHRYLGKPLTDKPYIPAHPGPQPKPTLPTHW